MQTLRRLSVLAVAMAWLSACGMKPEALSDPAPDASLSIPKAVKRLAPTTLPLVTTPGTWLYPPRGPLFEPMDTLDPRNAMVYIYRPHTSWEDQELQAPSFFVDGRKVFGLKSGSYTWLELHAGSYQFYAKRPLSILFIKKVFELPLNVVGGRTYYLRYSEDSHFDYAAEGLKQEDFMHAGFLQEVPESVALTEVSSLKLDQQGVYLAAGSEFQDRFTPFDAFPETGMDPEDLVPDATVPAEEEKQGWLQRARSIISNTTKVITDRF